MCLTLPGRILRASNDKAVVLVSGKEREVNIVFSSPIKADDWVLVNADLAIAKISEQEANELINYFSV